MKHRLLKIICLITFTVVLLAVSFPAFAANKVRIETDKTHVNMGDILRVVVTVELEDDDHVSNVQQPTYENFKVLNSNTSQQQYTSIVNFKMESKKTYTTTTDLEPIREGQFIVGPASFMQGNRKVLSNKIQVTVSKLDVEISTSFFGDQALSAPMTQLENQSQNVFFRFIAERASLVIGEQMAVTLYIYTSNTNVSRWGRVKVPTFSGFQSSQLELSDQGKIKSVVLSRQGYRVEALDRYLLTARQVGWHVINLYQVKAMMGDSQFFGGRWVGRRTTAFEIEIKPLPDENRPAGFRMSNIGTFNLSARVDRRKTEVGQPVTLSLILSGNTDMNRVAMPKLPAISGMKTYPPTEKTENYQKGNRLVGRKTAEYLIVPQKVGHLIIPSLTFTYFDTKTHLYRTLKTPKYRIRATPSTVKGGAAWTPTGDKHELMLEEGALRPLHNHADLKNKSGRVLGSTLFFVLFLVPIFVMVVWTLVDLTRRLWPIFFGAERSRRVKELRKYEKDLASRVASADQTFFADLKQAVYLALLIKTNEPLSGLTYSQLEQRLDRPDLQTHHEMILAFFKTCDETTFMPGDKHTLASDLFNQATQLFQDLLS